MTSFVQGPLIQVSSNSQWLERQNHRSDSKMRARHWLSCLTDGEIILLSYPVCWTSSWHAQHSFLHFAAKIKLVFVIVMRPSWAERGCSVFAITATKVTKPAAGLIAEPCTAADSRTKPNGLSLSCEIPCNAWWRCFNRFPFAFRPCPMTLRQLEWALNAASSIMGEYNRVFKRRSCHLGVYRIEIDQGRWP